MVWHQPGGAAGRQLALHRLAELGVWCTRAWHLHRALRLPTHPIHATAPQTSTRPANTRSSATAATRGGATWREPGRAGWGQLPPPGGTRRPAVLQSLHTSVDSKPCAHPPLVCIQVYPVNALAFNTAYGTFATGGALGGRGGVLLHGAAWRGCLGARQGAAPAGTAAGAASSQHAAGQYPSLHHHIQKQAATAWSTCGMGSTRSGWARWAAPPSVSRHRSGS